MTRKARNKWLTPAHVVDLFVYVVVLNLVAQFAPNVMTESFLISLLTALLLKVALELVLIAKKAALKRARGGPTVARRAVGYLTLLVLMPGSKFVVLVLVDLVFGAKVSLGTFLEVTALIVLLMLSRAGVRRLLGEPDPAAV